MNPKQFMEHKGYYGSYELSEEDAVFYGKIEFIRPLISYEGDTAKKIVKAFHLAVDSYLEDCRSKGKEPDRPFKGTFNIRVGEELHRKLTLAASRKKLTLNNYVKNLLEKSA